MNDDLTTLLNNPVPINKAALYTRLREILALGWQEMPKGVARYNGTGGLGQRLFMVGKKKAGRILDGRTWDEMPEVSR